ncbi:phage holin family protein [Planctellipticum variicoloris]|uniref:phage holin family protein n=1 Tax=Planctellipticum variicoloris TaxID=3064265 RepID=UPI003013E0AA|nr:phage holin family protein [Planctomycetaceae bacterium SH412]
MGPNSTGNRAGTGSDRGGRTRLDDQTPGLNGTHRSQTAGRPPFVALLVDGLRLVDLQIQLLSLDVREFWQPAWRAVLLLVAGSTALIAALPVALFGVAETLRSSWSFSIEFSLLAVSSVALVASGVLILWSARRLAAAAAPLKRSADELRENLSWMRSVLEEDQEEWRLRTR